jgi:thiamine biosynthesis lipoprotein
MISRSENGKPRVVRGFLLTALIAVVAVGCGGSKSDLVVLQGKAQGSTFTIKYIDSLQRDLSGPVDSLFRVIDRSLSLWDSTSTVNAFNVAADTFVSDDIHFRTVVALSEQLWHSTDSAFDPTVLPLVRAWGLGKQGRASLDTAAVLGLRRLVGMDRITMDNDWRIHATWPPRITYYKREAAVQFDPNGIAQGYTVDVLAMLLQQRGIEQYMVEVGGEVRCAGVNEQGKAWVMQIDKPLDGDEHVQQTTVPLRDRSLATSGNYRKFIEIGGQRYGHTIDPRTGRPAMNTLLSASVIADDAATADALGTALMVMGTEEAKGWLTQHRDVEAYLISDDGKGGYAVWSTAGWPAQ